MPPAKRRRSKVSQPHADLRLWQSVEPESSRRLLLAALDAFAAHGFHAATTREIGEGAGMSSAAVYVHFKAKPDLLFAISELGHKAVLAEVTRALAEAPSDPAERLRRFVFAFAKWHADNHTLARVIQYELKNLPPRQLRRIASLREQISEMLESELRRGLETGQFEITDLKGTALAILSLCIDLARWYEPGPTHSSDAIAELYSGLASRMVAAGAL